MSIGLAVMRRSVARDRPVASVLPWLAGTVLLSVALALVWLVRVPFFQEPDEGAHADYAFAFYDAGSLFRVRDALPATHVTAQERYLEGVSAYRRTRYDPYAAFPSDNGTFAYFRRVDAGAPARSHRVPTRGARLPYVMFSYPAPYYALAAGAMSLAGHSLVGALFAARLVGVLCLVGTLCFAYGVFRRLRLRAPAALLATAAIGLFPLTTWVSAYVQPDNLTTLLLTACLYAGLGWKARPFDVRQSLALGAVLAALAFVKFHFAAAALVVTQLRPSLPRGRVLVALALAIALPVAALGASLRLLPAGALQTPGWLGSGNTHAGALDVATYAVYAAEGLADVYFGGGAFGDYWMSFGFRGAGFVSDAARSWLTIAIVLVNAAAIGAFAIRQRVVLGAIARVARRRPLAALRLLGGDLVLNAYLATTGVLVLANALSRGTLWLEGRYWLPVIVPTIALAAVTLPRLAKAARRARLARLGAGAWAVYAALAAPVALFAMERNFHGPSRPATIEHYATIRRMVAGGRSIESGAIVVKRGQPLGVEGAAIDGETGYGATNVWIAIDGKRSVRADSRLPSVELSHELNDGAVATSGFAARIDTAGLAPGEHRLRALVIERRAPNGLPGHNTVAITVAP